MGSRGGLEWGGMQCDGAARSASVFVERRHHVKGELSGRNIFRCTSTDRGTAVWRRIGAISAGERDGTTRRRPRDFETARLVGTYVRCIGSREGWPAIGDGDEEGGFGDSPLRAIGQIEPIGVPRRAEARRRRDHSLRSARGTVSCELR